ncbi:PD-(D/E)XK nuclease family protein [Neolewinella aurantiaca]|uniref:PD-(D/E)XK nuclease family protein n=1 Tax=Neolewinella aurantiaca TaxID=2602767 RepID=A0A5C7FKM3_9BACT|nr:PD-(D/E)XK nuclease family protein [Neolewinella aurantiaca]TXF87875.1 PD-(D/E)XK nuclease family protein [Neolewinella aurantiaca]
MTILLGQTLSDALTLPAAPVNVADEAYMNPSGLLRYLEGFYALGAPSINREALRNEQYRQLLSAHLAMNEAEAGFAPFYQASFEADQTATAEELLGRRDELIDAGYPVHQEAGEETPERIRVLHELEALLHDDRYELNLLPGLADRLRVLLSVLPENRHPRLTIWLNEPRHLFGPGTRRLLDVLGNMGDTIKPLPDPSVPVTDNDLGRWQTILNNALISPSAESRRKAFLKGDGSLVILKARRETHIAAYLARLLKKNPDWQPGVLLPLRNQTLDNALLAEGLPSIGVPSTSLARPSLQVLKLVTTFLWKPMEIDRVMEFVSLVTKPLNWRLANRIAVFLADTPGMFGPRWFAMLEGFFREMEEDRNWPQSRLEATRKQYETWFRRRTYDRDAKVPKFDLRDLFNSLREWALEEFAELKKKNTENNGLLVLAAQALRAMELLDAQPETELSYLEVERLVRTVYEPAPTQFQHREKGALETIFAPASALKRPDGPELKQLIWWDFIEHEPDYFFSRYYPEELQFLRERGVQTNGPEEQNELSAWTQLRPVLHVRNQLILCLPELLNGSIVEAHPLLGDLEAAFPDGALDAITVNIDAAGEAPAVLAGKEAPRFVPVPVKPLAGPVPQLKIDRPGAIKERDPETPTALEDLLYYPYKWVFRHQLKLKGTPILSIAGENRLRGNLGHLFIERLLNQIKADGKAYTREMVAEWINGNWRKLLENEGAVLLEYGQEPERVQFVRTMHYAAWSLVHYLQENGWSIRGSEEVLEGELEPMGGQPVKGRADLVLERERNGRAEVAIVDLKWRGKTTFRNLLRNAKDVQLCLYAAFAIQDKERPADTVHTAYFVIRDALMIARNELAFANIETVSGPDDAVVVQRETLKKVRATYNWRWEQFHDGLVEVRCQETLGELEDLYLDLDHDSLLEPGSEDARFDDYRSLIGLVR